MRAQPLILPGEVTPDAAAAALGVDPLIVGLCVSNRTIISRREPGWGEYVYLDDARTVVLSGCRMPWVPADVCRCGNHVAPGLA